MVSYADPPYGRWQVVGKLSSDLMSVHTMAHLNVVPGTEIEVNDFLWIHWDDGAEQKSEMVVVRTVNGPYGREYDLELIRAVNERRYPTIPVRHPKGSFVYRVAPKEDPREVPSRPDPCHCPPGCVWVGLVSGAPSSS